MKKSHKTGLLRGLSSVFASLLVLMLCLTEVASSNAGVINRQLGTTNYSQRKKFWRYFFEGSLTAQE